MTEGHVRNALRLLIRKARKKHEQRLDLIAKVENLSFPGEQFFERPDNATILADLRRRHGTAVHVERSSMAGMDGSNVYVSGQYVGWFGGI